MTVSDVLTLLFCLMVSVLALKIDAVHKDIKKGNKDQQEIKTRLTWIKKRQRGGM